MKGTAHKTNTKTDSYRSLNATANVNDALVKSTSPISQSITSMLHKDRTSSMFTDIVDGLNFGHISKQIASKVSVYQSILDQLPDIREAIEIRTSMILSPTDLLTTSLAYNCNSSLLPPILTDGLLRIIRETFDGTEYNLKHYLKEIVFDVLGRTGSYALAVIPEPAINDIINDVDSVAIEDFNNKTYTQKIEEGRVFAVESSFDYSIKYNNEYKRLNKVVSILDYKINERVETITEGYTYLINKARVEKSLNNTNIKVKDLNLALGDIIATENIDSNASDKKLNKSDFLKIKSSLFQTKPLTTHRVIRINEVDWSVRPAIDHPLVKHIPSECVFPIHMPGDPKSHIGYLVASDKYSQPISQPLQSSSLDNFYNNMGTGNSNSTYDTVINEIGRWGTGTSCNYTNGIDSGQILNFAKRIIEDDVTYRLYNGTYNSSSLKVSCPENVALIMLSYRLMDLNITLQYIPASLMTYFCIDVDELGIGVPLTDRIKYIASLRSAAQLANTMSGIKNSIGVTKLNITVDDADPQIKQTITQITKRVAEARSMKAIINNASPESLSNFMGSYMMQMKISADSGKMESGIDPIPATQVEVTEESPEYPGVSSDLLEDLESKSILGIGVAAQVVKGSLEGNFAIETIYNDRMLVRRSLENKLQFDVGITSHVKQFSFNSGRIMNRLTNYIKENAIDYSEVLKGSYLKTIKDVIDEFLENLSVTLPEPNVTKYDSQLDALTSYIELVDKAIEFTVQNNVVGSLFKAINGEDSKAYAGVSDEILVGIIRANLVRSFMIQNGILPELFKVFDKNIDDTNLESLFDSEIENASDLFDIYKKAKYQILDIMKDVDKINNNSEDTPDGGDVNNNQSDGDDAFNDDFTSSDIDSGNTSVDSTDNNIPETDDDFGYMESIDNNLIDSHNVDFNTSFIESRKR